MWFLKMSQLQSRVVASVQGKCFLVTVDKQALGQAMGFSSRNLLVAVDERASTGDGI